MDCVSQVHFLLRVLLSTPIDQFAFPQAKNRCRRPTVAQAINRRGEIN
jgi:hypothetical protein